MKPETQFLIQYLRDVPVGEIADYPALSHHAGVKDIRDLKHRHYLASAIKHVLREYGKDFENVPSIGYRCVEPESVPKLASRKRTSKIRTQTRLWRDAIVQSGQATSLDGMRSLNECAFAEFAVSLEAQKHIGKTTKVVDLRSNASKAFEIFFGATEC